MDHDPHYHIKKLKNHRKVLYAIVMLLLILQIVTFISVSSQITRLTLQQDALEDALGGQITLIRGDLSDTRQETQFSINTITRQLAQQENTIQSQIDLLKASKQDFSGVIENVIRGVVSITTDRSGGTGFAITSDGYIVTNYHVIANAEFVRVQVFDGSIYDAQVIGSDPTTDLALLKVEASFIPLELAESNDVTIGEKVIAIGNPLGLSFTVTEGIVSATDRQGPNGMNAYIQTDVTLNPGNSGGPLINTDGKVIGINNFKVGNAESLGFALESRVIKEIINSIIQKELI